SRSAMETGRDLDCAADVLWAPWLHFYEDMIWAIESPSVRWRTPALTSQGACGWPAIPAAFRARFWVGQLEFLERIKHDPGDNQPGVFLVVGGYDIPGGSAGACGAEAFLIGLHVVPPEFSLFNVCETEFEVFSGSSIRSRKRF